MCNKENAKLTPPVHNGGDDLVELDVEINVDAREDRRRPRGTACKKDEHEKQRGEQAQARACLHGRCLRGRSFEDSIPCLVVVAVKNRKARRSLKSALPAH